MIVRVRGSLFPFTLLWAGLFGSACAPDQRLTRAANALDKDLQREATERVEARVHPHLVAAHADDEVQGPRERGLGEVTAAKVRTMVEVAPGVVLPAVWTQDGWKLDVDVSDLFPAATPRQALRSFLRALELEEWEIVAGFAPRRFREDLTPEALRQAWTDGPESAALRKARDLLEAGLEGPLFMDAHSATLVLSGDRAAHLEREGARWLLVDF